MGKLKDYYYDYLTSEDFDLMVDDEYEQWIELQENKINLNKTN
jgi:hypothetical protein